jgi:hypothetical protein
MDSPWATSGEDKAKQIHESDGYLLSHRVSRIRNFKLKLIHSFQVNQVRVLRKSPLLGQYAPNTDNVEEVTASNWFHRNDLSANL